MRMNLKDRAGGLATANLHWEQSLNVVFPPLLVNDRTLLALES
jgi:hypothetical protein